ncbi:MAG TPA: hypothetical protein PLP19_05115 [bacterium]|nr:hypothetical protein [bacterium]HPN42850.1 hypothetical protein [bacterium]
MKKIFILILLLPVLSCEIDHGLGTMDSRITGKIIFINPDKKPDYVESVRIVAVANYPPESLGDLVITNTSVNLSKEQPEYYIPAPLATYHLVGAIFKEKGHNWDYGNLLSYYGFDPVNYKIDIIPIVLSKQHPIAYNIDIICDWSLLPEKKEN